MAHHSTLPFCFLWISGMSLLMRWKVSGQLSGWKSLRVGLASYSMFGHWWRHLFLQIVILTEQDFRHESPSLIIAYWKLIVFPTFVKLCMCVLPIKFLQCSGMRFCCLPFYSFLPSALIGVLEWITEVLWVWWKVKKSGH